MMLSRVAESFYWYGRYLERAENTARLMLSYADMILDLPLKSRVDWDQLVEITGSQATFERLGVRATELGILRFLIDHPDNPGSLRCSIAAARENLRSTRDRVPREVSESTNELWAYVKEAGPESIRRSAARARFLRGLIDRCQTLRGYMGGSMSRNQAYYFIRFGRMLERADMTTRIMDVRIDDLLPDEVGNLPAFDAVQWMSVLRSLSAYQMYRQEVQGKVKALDVIEFLFLSQSFPRSVHHSLLAARRCAQALPRPDKIIAAVDALMQSTANLQARTLAENSGKLRQSIDAIQAEIIQIDRLFTQTYFAPASPGASQQQQTA